jgi:hypothetical protein
MRFKGTVRAKLVEAGRASTLSLISSVPTAR